MSGENPFTKASYFVSNGGIKSREALKLRNYPLPFSRERVKTIKDASEQEEHRYDNQRSIGVLVPTTAVDPYWYPVEVSLEKARIVAETCAKIQTEDPTHVLEEGKNIMTNDCIWVVGRGDNAIGLNKPLSDTDELTKKRFEELVKFYHNVTCGEGIPVYNASGITFVPTSFDVAQAQSYRISMEVGRLNPQCSLTDVARLVDRNSRISGGMTVFDAVRTGFIEPYREFQWQLEACEKQDDLWQAQIVERGSLSSDSANYHSLNPMLLGMFPKS